MLERTSRDHPAQTLSAKSKQGWSDQKALKHILISWMPPRIENPLLLSEPVPVFVPHDDPMEKSLLFFFWISYVQTCSRCLMSIYYTFIKSLNPSSVSSIRELQTAVTFPLHLFICWIETFSQPLCIHPVLQDPTILAGLCWTRSNMSISFLSWILSWTGYYPEVDTPYLVSKVPSREEG